MATATDDRLYLERWARLTEKQQLGMAREVDDRLGEAFRLLDVRAYTLGEQTQRVARYEWTGRGTKAKATARKAAARKKAKKKKQGSKDGSTATRLFHLIPGGTVELGIDLTGGLPIEFDFSAAGSWEDFLHLWRDSNLKGQVAQEQLRTNLTEPRTVRLEPFLMEVEPTHTPTDSCSVAGARKLAKGDGFRLPRSDEWEHACGAGSRTMFPWGNLVPDRLPGNEGSTRDAIEMQPNAFGLIIGHDPYDWEFVSDPNEMRGGDGGGAICGGDGYFWAWLSLATAYRARPVYSGLIRRCLDLP